LATVQRGEGLQGKIYRVLATPQTLFVLSDKGLYVWQELVQQVFSQRSTHVRLQPLVIPMEAIDISIFDEHLFFVLAENGIAGLPLRDLEVGPIDHIATDHESRRSVEMSQHAQMEDIAPEMKWYESQQEVTLHPVEQWPK
jgi:hypothetical protein